MHKNNKSFTEKCKEHGRKVFLKMGHSAIGNTLGDDNFRGKTDIVPFSFVTSWSYEKPMPKRKK